MNMIHCELCCYSSSPGAPYSLQQEQADRVKEEQINNKTDNTTSEYVEQLVSVSANEKYPLYEFSLYYIIVLGIAVRFCSCTLMMW